jgi:hypothetical protein
MISPTRHGHPVFHANPNRVLFLACLLAAAFPLTARATDDTWSTATSGNFSTGPWSPGVPGSADNALFTANGTYTVTFTTAPSNTAFQVSAGNVTFNAGPAIESYSLTGTSSVSGAATLTLGAAGSAFTVGTGAISVNGSAADMIVASHAALLISGLNIGTLSSNVGTLTNAGSISLLTASTLNIGTGANSSGLLNLTAGTFTTGTGATTIGAGGKLTMNGGAFNANDDITVSGGTLTQSTGAFTWADAHTMTINSGGLVSLTGIWAPANNDLITLSGAGSRFNDTGASADLFIEHGTTMTLGAGTSVHSDQFIDIGEHGNGVVTVDGAGASFTAAAAAGTGFNDIGNAGTGVLTFINTATGTITSGFQIGNANNSSGTLSVLSSAAITTGQLNLAAIGTTAVAVVNVTGGTLTQTGPAGITVGSGSGGSATLTVGAGGVLTTGSGTTILNATGQINIAGTFNEKGDLSVVGGTLTQTDGTFSFAASHNMTIQAGGQVTLINSFTTATSDAISVIGSASQLAVTGPGADLAINNGATLTASSGGVVHSNTYFDIASTGNGSASFDGSGTFLTSDGTVADGQNLLGTAGAGTLTLSSSATGIFPGGIIVGESPGSSGTLNVQSNALLTTGQLNVASFGFAATGIINVTGGTLTQSGPAALFVGGNAGAATVTVGTGGVFNTGTGAATIGATGVVNIAGTLNFNGDILVDGGTITQSAGAFSWAAGHTMTIQGGGLLSLPGSYGTPAGVIILTGTSSQLYDTGASADFRIINGASVSAVARSTLRSDGFIDVGNGTLTVSGLLSSLTASSTSRESFISNGVGTTSIVTLSTSATGSLPGGMRVGNAGGTGTVNILSSASLTTGPVDIASNAASSTGQITVTGGTLTQSGATTLTIGSPSLSTGLLVVGPGGVYTTGTGLTTINATGTAQISGGTLNQNGDITVAGGVLTLSSGNFTWANAHTLTLQSGGAATFTGTFATPTGSFISVTGAGSLLDTVGAAANLRVLNGATISVDQGGVLHSDQFLNIPNGVVTVNGSGSSLSAAAPATGAENIIGNNTLAGSLFFTNSATASVTNGFELGHTNGSGVLSVQSSANVTSGSIDVASDVSSSTGSLTVTGGTLTLSGAAHLTVGRSSNGNATVTLGAGGVLSTGTGLTAINPTGVVNISGGAFNPNGDLTLTSGSVTQTSGSFTWAANHTLTIQSGGVLTLAGTYSTPANAIISITGAGSLLSDTGATTASLTVGNNTTLTVTSGGVLHSDLLFSFGTAGGSGIATINGTGSAITSNASATAGQSHLGTIGFGSLSLINAATGSLPNGLQIGNASGSTGSLSVLSAAALTMGSLDVGSTPATLLASVNVTGGTLTLSGASTLTIGASSLSAASATVGAAGILTTGTGAVTLNPTANLTVQSGGTLNLKGNISIAAGASLTSSGTFNGLANVSNAGTLSLSGTQTWAANTTFTNTAGTATFSTSPDAASAGHLFITVSGGTVSLASLDNLGVLTLTGGTTKLTGSATTSSLSASISVSANATLELAASYDFTLASAPALTGTGQIIIDPGATLSLRVDSAFAGTIVIKGTLFLAPALDPNAPTFNFSVLSTPSPVPEPASLTLLAFAPIVLRRRRSKTAATMMPRA